MNGGSIAKIRGKNGNVKNVKIKKSDSRKTILIPSRKWIESEKSFKKIKIIRKFKKKK
jgi:hypothetical protein